jgi:hypothetical protein
LCSFWYRLFSFCLLIKLLELQKKSVLVEIEFVVENFRLTDLCPRLLRLLVVPTSNKHLKKL